ncbi:hypothetical protein BJX63DRAFT_170031 [Aspergillus granulosus]|uniref:DUF7702 domain-containing protein n=1 Tax=Aspergillus granulosus TaxID=176169 RepID=A0ABR4HIG2_9EURO
MPLTPHQSLALALLILYTPALIPTSLLLYRHSLGHVWGWLYLFIFTLLRIVGAALQFASGYTHGSENGLRIAAEMFASIGVMTLLLGMLEEIEIVKPSLPTNPIPPRLWTLLYLSQYAAFILSIVFTATGRDDLGYASAAIVACLFVAQVGIVISFYFSLRRTPSASEQDSSPTLDLHNTTASDSSTSNLKSGDVSSSRIPRLSKAKATTLLHIFLLSTPFLAVRVVYMLLATFTHDSSLTRRDLPNNTNDQHGGTQAWTKAETERYILPNVYVVAFMQYAMEFVVFALFVAGGFVVPALRRDRLREGNGERSLIDSRDTNRRSNRGWFGFSNPL